MRISPKQQVAIGALLNAVSWSTAWAGPEPYRYHTFFPLWLGLIIAVDGFTRWKTGTSVICRLRYRFILLFAYSIPIWWLFEIANKRLQNWSYVLPQDYSWLRYHLESSLAFSTVAPAIFVMTELVSATMIRRPLRWIRLAPTRNQLIALSVAGAALFVATMCWPDLLFPMTWISIFLAVDPLVRLLNGRCVSGPVAEGRWTLVGALFLGTLICGFFWEFWNFWSMPKWKYDIAYADWFRLFEMPALGYGGYLPFGLEVFAVVCLADRLLGSRLSTSLRWAHEDDL